MVRFFGGLIDLKTKVLIIGYYGANNIGDEVLLDATIELINSVYDAPKITVLTNDIEDTIKKREVAGVHRNHYMQIIKSIRDTDVVIGGGGSMLQNITSNQSLIYYLAILWLSKLFGKKVALLGNGIGPLRTTFYQNLTKYVLKKLDAIVLRDVDSYNLLKQFNLTNIHLANDLVYTLDEMKISTKLEKKILINLRKWDYDPSFIETMEKFIEYLISEDFNVTLISFQSGNDDLILKGIYNRIDAVELNYFESTAYDKIMQEISSAELFIGMRLHGLIFSSIANTPFIGLSYDPKVRTLSKHMGQEYFEDLNILTLNGMIHTFENVFKNKEDYEEKLRRKTEEVKESNHVHVKVLEELK